MNIVMKALAPSVSNRYQRAADLLADVLALGKDTNARRSGRTPVLESAGGATSSQLQEIHSRLRARETPTARLRWHCRKPQHARSDRCPFCGESQ